jgi:hypothetical protein
VFIFRKINYFFFRAFFGAGRTSDFCIAFHSAPEIASTTTFLSTCLSASEAVSGTVALENQHR